MSLSASTHDGRSHRTFLVAAAPAVFVLLWSTGFIGAKLGLPYAEPFTFLALRFALVSALLLAIALIIGSPWPGSIRGMLHTMIAGLLLQGVYLGGVFVAISAGLEAGIAALIVGLQPLLTAALARWFLNERVNRVQFAGLALGFAGVTLVVWNKLDPAGGTPAGVVLCAGALLGITLGTLYQKRYCSDQSLVTGNLIQFFATSVAMGVLALIFETREIQWSPQFLFALGWLVVVLSLGAITLLYLLIRRGAAARVASLFYLVPPVTTLLAWWLFNERLGPLSLAGMVAAVTGVALVNLGERSGALFRH